MLIIARQGGEPAVPDQPDDNLVPPIKVMRKRLNGVYRADSGFSGPTRRYVLIVAMLVGLASLPTLAAITAGSNELADGKTDTMDIPVLPPASPGPVIGSPPVDGERPASGLPPSAQGGSDGAQGAGRTGRLMGGGGTRGSRPSTPAAGPVDGSPSRSRKVHGAASSGSDKGSGPDEPPS